MNEELLANMLFGTPMGQIGMNQSDMSETEYEVPEDDVPNEALTGAAPDIDKYPKPEAMEQITNHRLLLEGGQFDQFKQSILADIKEANKYYENRIEPVLSLRHKIYTADRDYYKDRFPLMSRQSDFVSYDFWSFIEWAIPSIMGSFFGSSNEAVVIVGRGPEDTHRADIMKQLIRYQIMTQNNGFLVFGDWFSDAMQYNLGAVKVYWKRRLEWGEEMLQSVPMDRLMFMQNDPSYKIYSVGQPNEFGLIDVSYSVQRMAENRPVIEPIRITELRWSPEARSLGEANFVAHRKYVSADHLRRQVKAGVYDSMAVERAIEASQSDTLNKLSFESELDDTDAWDYKRDHEEEARKEFELYECYVKLDINGDGLLEDALVTVVGDEIVRVDNNEWGRVPIFTVSPVRDPFRVLAPQSLAEIIGELQSLKVALMRQIIINTANTNNFRFFVDKSKIVDTKDLKSNSQFIQTNGDPTKIVVPFPQGTLASWTMPFLEYLEGTMEQWTGRTRYNQGTDSTSLNKTATGISLLQQASAQRIDYIVRVFAETGVSELMRFLVELNQRYIDQPQVIRLSNEFLQITPDDIKGEFDIDVNTEAGVGRRQQTIQNMQYYLAGIAPMGMQIGAITPAHWAKAAQKLLQESGERAPQEYVADPNIVQQQFFQQMAQNMVAQLAGVAQDAQTQQAQPQQQQQSQPKPPQEAQSPQEKGYETRKQVFGVGGQ